MIGQRLKRKLTGVFVRLAVGVLLGTGVTEDNVEGLPKSGDSLKYPKSAKLYLNNEKWVGQNVKSVKLTRSMECCPFNKQHGRRMWAWIEKGEVPPFSIPI
jgi:hypothetical protein